MTPRSTVLQLLCIADPLVKAQSVLDWQPTVAWDLQTVMAEPACDLPGRMQRPELVEPRQVKQRSLQTAVGRATLIHALAHIECNAINLALDILWRFSGQPKAFYDDWLRVAKDESRHFLMLHDHLISLGYGYGDFPAHQGLWDMADRTRDDILARLALVPRTLEARGLDASPAIRDKLAQVGDLKAARLLDIILHDEIEHVAIGNRWYRHECERRGVDSLPTYDELALRYRAPKVRGPLNHAARLQAGFLPEELASLERSLADPQ